MAVPGGISSGSQALAGPQHAQMVAWCAFAEQRRPLHSSRASPQQHAPDGLDRTVRIHLDAVDRLSLPPPVAARLVDHKHQSLQLLLSVFDAATGQFVGRTERSSAVPLEKDTAVFDEAMYCILASTTTTTTAAALGPGKLFVVVEVVVFPEVGDQAAAAADPGPGPRDQHSRPGADPALTLSCGWTLIDLLQEERGDGAALREAPLYTGTPRALLSLETPVLRSLQRLGRPLMRSALSYDLQQHKALSTVADLLPPNQVVGHETIVPGLRRDLGPSEFDPRFTLDRPMTHRRLRCCLDGLTVSFLTHRKSFEALLLSRVKESLHSGAVGVVESRITERKLKVGVHNGLRYIHDEPSIAGLVPHPTDPDALCFKGVLDLNHLYVHPWMAIVVQLEYTLSTTTPQPAVAAAANSSRRSLRRRASSSKPGAASALAQETITHHVVRWAPLLPFAEGQDSAGAPESELEATLFAGPRPSLGGQPVYTGLMAPADNRRFLHAQHMPVKVAGIMMLADEADGDGQLRRAGLSRIGSQESLHRLSHAAGAAAPIPSPMPVVHGNRSQRPDSASGRPPAMPRSLRKGRGSRPVSAVVPAEMQQADTLPDILPALPQAQSAAPPARREHPMVAGRQLVEPRPSTATAAAGNQDLKETAVRLNRPPLVATGPAATGVQGGGGPESVLSRAAMAALFGAGFPDLIRSEDLPEAYGHPAMPVHAVGQGTRRLDLAAEIQDPFQTQDIRLQFMAASFRPDNAGARRAGLPSDAGPKHVFFTFKFYRFLAHTSPLLTVEGAPEGGPGDSDGASPRILRAADSDGPGFEVRHSVDPASMRPDETSRFARYLSSKVLQIDVWDGDSLMLIGSAGLDLRSLLRGGQRAVQSLLELDLVRLDYLDGDLDMRPEEIVSNAARAGLPTETKGSIFVRVANIGRPSVASGRPRQPPSTLVAPPSRSQFVAPKGQRAARMVDKDPELAAIVSQHGAQHKLNEDLRKTRRLQAIKQRKLNATTGQLGMSRTVASSNALGSATLGSQGASTMHTIDMYRVRHKKDQILDLLHKSITAAHHIRPSFGEAVYFQYLLVNTLEEDLVLNLHWEDPEITAVQDVRAWRHLNTVFKSNTPVEDNLFQQSGDGLSLFLRAKEEVYVPFKFQSFAAGQPVAPGAEQGRSRPTIGQATAGPAAPGQGITKRSTKIAFKRRGGGLFAALVVHVEPQAFVVDQTFRFWHPQHQFLKKLVRLPPPTADADPHRRLAAHSNRAVHLVARASNPGVVCEARTAGPSDPRDVFVKYACGANPEVASFCVALYEDEHLCTPWQVWQFHVHSLEQVSLTACLGQKASTSLLVHGGSSSRLVQCFSSNPSELTVSPHKPCLLAPGSPNEIGLTLSPSRIGHREHYVNLVDVEFHQLIKTWTVTTTVQPPTITKAFEMALPVGQSAMKRVSYSNPYPDARRFYLQTDREDLLELKQHVLEIPALSSVYISMHFRPVAAPAKAEVLVFINDEQDRNEECFVVRVLYAPPNPQSEA